MKLNKSANLYNRKPISHKTMHHQFWNLWSMLRVKCRRKK